MSTKPQLVYPGFRGGWNVKTYGALRAAKNFDSQGDAIAWARSKCKRQGLELVLFNRNGTVRTSHLYRKRLSELQQQNSHK
jgi:hypothetical protein